MSAQQQLLTYVIDSETCAGHGRCYGLAPDAFEPDDNGYGRVIGSPRPAGDRSQMEEIASQCPEQAISVRPVETQS
jgi:ferredoxin